MQKNPFTSTTAASQDLFVGRNPEIKNLVKYIDYQGRSVAILGGSKIGKTSLLNIALEKIRNTGDKKYFYEIIDAGYIATLNSADEAFSYVVQHLNNKIDPQLLGNPNNIDSFSKALADMDKNNPNVRILLIIDYADALFQMPYWQSFTRRLSHFIQGDFKNIGIIFMGKPPFYANLGLGEVASPLYGLISLVRMTALSESETRTLINLKSVSIMHADVEDRLVLETGGHPFLIQWFMENLFDECNGDLKLARIINIESLVNQFYSERSECKRWFDKFNMLETEIYKHITNNERSKNELANMGLRIIRDSRIESATGDEVSEALQNLFNSGFISQNISTMKYFASGQLLARYFRKHIEKNDNLISGLSG